MYCDKFETKKFLVPAELVVSSSSIKRIFLALILARRLLELSSSADSDPLEVWAFREKVFFFPNLGLQVEAVSQHTRVLQDKMISLLKGFDGTLVAEFLFEVVVRYSGIYFLFLL